MSHKKGANFVKYWQILMLSSVLDLEKNCICDGMNFTHLTWLVLLHQLVKVKTPKTKMHSAFNVNYEIAVKCTKLHWQFHRMFGWTT